MPHFEYSSWIDAPVEKVFAFHARPDALELLIPPGQNVQMISRQGGLEKGARVVLRMKLGPFSLDWVALHTGYEKNRFFEDEQVSGPFRKWKHRHNFTAENGGTRLTDSVEFSLFGAPVTDLFGGWAAKAQLQKMFEYRHAVTKRESVRP